MKKMSAVLVICLGVLLAVMLAACGGNTATTVPDNGNALPYAEPMVEEVVVIEVVGEHDELALAYTEDGELTTTVVEDVPTVGGGERRG